MKREIKFRARNYVGEWQYGSLSVKRKTVNGDTVEVCRILAIGDDRVFAAKPDTVGQFTGLFDKDGKEIYEGDIVKFTYWWFDGNVAESELKGEVVYLEQFMSFGLKGVKNREWIRHIGREDGDSDTSPFAVWTFDEADFEIIGNIHDNPELLKNE
jgi:uncharacterized phage protein (TIGR01671 family)